VFRTWRSADFQSAVSHGFQPAGLAEGWAFAELRDPADWKSATRQIGNLRYACAAAMNASGARLGAITKELWVQWQQTREYWKDAKSEEFEHKFLDELIASVDKTVTVIDQLDKLISKIRKDCE